ncbi:phage tail protein [Lactiplantibacillus plantarum]|uniref:phage tail protein n=3 Tax=Lactiplantibacillus plantarum TaxID=1590 RepID=UPI00295ADAB8|nr:phage tail protein [Lactiplantibacillus plantarum]MDV9113355.1 gp58-like family protein [Lactiplantibacillus plantarum]
MIKFHDPSGAPHFGQATITRTTSVNGGLSLTGEVFAGGDVLNGLDYGWWLNFDNEKYVITYKKLSDDTNTVVFDAIQQFFWDFAKVALHAQYTGSHEYTFYLGQLFDKSGYTYKNDVTVPAFEKENWGYKNKLDLFNDIIDQAGVEFEVHNETVHIAKQIGSDLTSFARKGINLSDLTEEMKISDFATYAKGYGAFKDAEDQSKGRLEVEYRSELAKQFGDLEMDPIVDERYTIADNLIAALKKQVDATYTVSMTMNIYDLENAGYPNYEVPKVGDWILAIDEALNFKRKIRIIQLEEQFDVTGKRIGYTATCGDLSIVDQYTHLQSSLDSKVQRIQESVDNALSSANGKSTNYYGEKEPTSANEGDLWFDQSDSDPDKWSIKQWVNGRWQQITLNPGEVDAKVDAAKKKAETAAENAKSASDKADQLAAKYDDTNALANQALDKAVGAQSDASIAVATANSTASEFGKVDQKADSALANALNAQNAASSAVAQASFAAADSKDAKQIAGAVSQSYKTLTDGSTMTIAELENGLATKLTKTDLDGYATETWTQNQIKVTADGINATLSSVKSTVDGQTTSINDLKADSNSFKSQFTTVNNTLGKQTTDIGSLQATSKELTTGFNTLTTDNTTNKNDISQLKQTATEVSSTLETVQTQVQNSAVGTNLLLNSDKQFTNSRVGQEFVATTFNLNDIFDKYGTDQVYTISYDLSSKDPSKVNWIQAYTYPGTTPQNKYSFPAVRHQGITTTPQRFSMTFKPKLFDKTIPRTTLVFYGQYDSGNIPIVNHVKVEKGSLSTDWCPNPADNATVTALSKLSQTVDGMKADISKKIEKKDLNGYATETWAQNQINISANGINGTISSVKSTVDGHTTSINNLQADSNGFKAQFTTVNNTIGKHTTDIGTLQATNKSLVASYDSLNADNSVNQHNISQLQLTANSFSTTLATVQQQVTDSAVGTNLLLKTYAPFSMTGLNIGNQWQQMYALSRRLEAETTVTLSFDAVSTAFANFTIQNNGNLDGETWMGYITATVDTTKKHYVATITLDGFTQQGVNIRVDNMPLTTTITISNMKLELGSNATDYSENPADNATVDAVSSISQTVDAIQTTVRGKVDNDVYQSKMTQLDSQITTVVGQVNSLGQKNLIANSQFQYDWQNSWSISSHDWANWYTSNFTWAWLDGYQGICANIPQSQSESWPHIQSSDVAVPDPGVTAYSASVYVNIDWVETYCVLDMSFYNAAGVRTFHDTTASNKGLNFLKLENIVSPKDAVRVHIELHVHDHGHAAFIEPMFVQDSSVGKYIPDNASWTEVQQTYNSINLKVSKDGVINAVNISPEGIQIYGNKLHITAATYIDNAVIKDAMIANLNANKLTAGSINAANINVYNINGANIVANSITANQLQAGSLLIALNSTMQTMRIGTDGLYTTDNKGDGVGHIHTNSVVGHPDVYGLNFDLDATGDYMGWGAKNRGDPNGTYAIKLGWYRSDTANTIGNIKGFVFSDQVTLNGGIQVSGAYQNLGFGTSTFNNNTHYPYFGSTGMKAGLAYGSTDTYLISDGKYADMTKVIFALQGIGDAYIPVKLSDGKITSYVKVNFQH